MKTWITEGWDDVPSDFVGITIGRDGTHREWVIRKKYHREDGPAIEYKDGHGRWYLDGVEYTEEGHRIEIAVRNSTLGKLILKEKTFKLEDS